jgi:hypothetical protein
LPWGIAAGEADAGRLFADGSGHGLLDQALRTAGIFVALVHRQGVAHLGGMDPLVAEEFDVPDAAAGEQWRRAKQHPQQHAGFADLFRRRHIY